MFVIGYHQNESSQQHTQNLTIERQNSYTEGVHTEGGGRKMFKFCRCFVHKFRTKGGFGEVGNPKELRTSYVYHP